MQGNLLKLRSVAACTPETAIPFLGGYRSIGPPIRQLKPESVLAVSLLLLVLRRNTLYSERLAAAAVTAGLPRSDGELFFHV